MSTSINDIIINIVDASQVAQSVNFGVPVLIGFTGSKEIVKHGTGTSGLVIKSKARHDEFSVKITYDTAYNYNLTTTDLLEIECPNTARVRDLIADFYANAPTTILNKFDIVAISSGAGIVQELTTPQASNRINYLRIEDLSQIEYYYEQTDAEYTIIKNILASRPSPNVCYLFDVYNTPLNQLPTKFTEKDNGDWFCVLTTATTQNEISTIADWVDGRDRIALFTSNDANILDNVKSEKIAFLIHDRPQDHPEASWGAKCLPAVPTVGWKWQSNLQGQQANSTATLSDLILIRNKNGNSYVRRSGIDYVDGSQCNPQSGKIHIDQIVGRLWIKLNLQNDIFNLFVRTAAEGRKIPYTDAGIELIKNTIANRLAIAGNLGIIAQVETPEQAKLSYDGVYRYRVTSMTRSEIEQTAPTDIVNRVLRGVRYSYVETGAIERVEITGVVLLTE